MPKPDELWSPSGKSTKSRSALSRQNIPILNWNLRVKRASFGNSGNKQLIITVVILGLWNRNGTSWKHARSTPLPTSESAWITRKRRIAACSLMLTFWKHRIRPRLATDSTNKAKNKWIHQLFFRQLKISNLAMQQLLLFNFIFLISLLLFYIQSFYLNKHSKIQIWFVQKDQRDYDLLIRAT